MSKGGTMTDSSKVMTVTDLISVSSSILETSGYQSVHTRFSEWNTTTTRLFENKYNVVGLAVFEATNELLRSWADLQGSLVEVISRYVGLSEGKAWDGYLVLLTTGIAPSSDTDIEGLRYDTTRLRKLVATGEELASAGDVERVLRPLLPLQTPVGFIKEETALDLLPALLAERGVKTEFTEMLIKSFIGQEPLMDVIHRARRTE